MESSLHQVADKFSLLSFYSNYWGRQCDGSSALSVLWEESEEGVETASKPGEADDIVLSPGLPAGSERVPDKA